ncbi:hypothetical protein EYF80_008713 [Liparis tanakae]|uniref:Uncharacterized protein n=1 Tax=Liparis tanakae TaxID=230148 RepID=A0A4Z2ITI0_9TELE|nr:hypothetical protein EYF80_008713 [Liparis tanakae]
MPVRSRLCLRLAVETRRSAHDERRLDRNRYRDAQYLYVPCRYGISSGPSRVCLSPGLFESFSLLASPRCSPLALRRQDTLCL